MIQARVLPDVLFLGTTMPTLTKETFANAVVDGDSWELRRLSKAYGAFALFIKRSLVAELMTGLREQSRPMDNLIRSRMEIYRCACFVKNNNLCDLTGSSNPDMTPEAKASRIRS